ncbi:MAG: TetR/AcrR family transcriptional regulator [Deltaproteobacteria bacterium]|nr:TetR/AcrR family transcriptional regulator [Deltaproteobacteria bacterium]
MQDEKIPRREREKLTQRSHMLAAALELFSEKGFHNVSMHEIAKRAEFAIGTLYKFFQNKEDLYKALVLEQSDKFHVALVRAIDEPGDEIERLRKYIVTKGELFREHLAFIRIYLAENRGASYNIKAGLDDEIRKRYDAFLERLASIIDNGIQKKRFRNIAQPYSLAVALDSTVNAFLLLWIDAPEEHPYPEDPDAILNIFLKGLSAE